MTELSIAFPLDEIVAAVRNVVRDELAREHPTGFLNVEGAASFLSSTPAAVRSLVKRNAIPFHRTANGRLLFDHSELDQWVRQG